MRKVLKWVGIVVGVLLVAVVLVVGVGYARGSAKLNATYDFELENIEIPTDAESIANGEYLAHSLVGCTGCHGEDLSGQELINDPSFIVLYSANLTSGEGGVGATFTDEDWIRAIRHGLGPDNETLLVMPAQYFSKLSAEDTGDIIAYIKSLPPVDNVHPKHQVAFMPRVLVGLGVLPPKDVAEIMPATGIDHNAAVPTMPQKGVTEEWGQYRATICTACHGPQLAGIPANDQTGSAASANLTPGGELLTWTVDDFLHFMRTGITPSGHQVDGEEMPWPEFAHASDDDLTAIFLYLKSLDPLETYTGFE